MTHLTAEIRPLSVCLCCPPLVAAAMSTDAQWLAHTIVVADGRWYPLHQLARWSGAVAVAAPAAAVKQSMAEARASIDARCRSRTRTHADAAPMQLHDAYRKIGNVVSVTRHHDFPPDWMR